MVIVASILGLLAGITGMMAAVGIDISALHLPPTWPSIGDVVAPDGLARLAGPLAMLLGVLVLIPERRIGAALMLIGAAAMALTFSVQATTVIPVVFGALAAAAAIYSDMKRSQGRS